MASIADTHDGLAALARRRDDPRLAELVVLLDLARIGYGPADYERVAVALIRDRLFGDLEDPATDPELGEHTRRRRSA